jgi:hypothetical protein
LFILGFLFLNLYVGHLWARWLLVALSLWFAIGSIRVVIGPSRQLQTGVVLLVGLSDATYLFVAWKLSRSPDLKPLLAARGRRTPTTLTRFLGVVSYSFATVLLFGAAAHLPFLKSCLSASGCTGNEDAIGLALLLVFLVVIIVAGWTGRLPGYGGRPG